jgi:hypothetical protein
MAPDEIVLPTSIAVAVRSGIPVACGGIGFDRSTLYGDPKDPRVAWLVSATGARMDVVWPAGYRARFRPRLEVVDAAGSVVLRAGDTVSGGCGTANPSFLLMYPPFK